MASRLVRLPSKRRTLLGIAVFALFLGLFITLLVLDLQNGVAQANMTRILRFVVIILIYAYFIFGGLIKVRLHTAKVWKDPSTRRLIEGDISNEGITISPLKDIALKWADIAKVHRTGNMYVLHTVDSRMFALPSHFFARQRDWETARDFIDGRVVETK